MRVLEQEVIPLFYDRDIDGLPRHWIQRMMNSHQLAGLAIQLAPHGGRLRNALLSAGRRRLKLRYDGAVGIGFLSCVIL